MTDIVDAVFGLFMLVLVCTVCVLIELAWIGFKLEEVVVLLGGGG